jgi:DNA-binding winged helix-turn-helix (wHTH) protein
MDRFQSASAGFAHAGYRFNGFRLEADGTLLYGETRIHLSPKELAALRLLLANPGLVVTPLDMKQALWGDPPAAADSVSKCMASLRNKLQPHECIETVYKRGYRLSVAVSPLNEPSGTLLRLAILPFNVGYGVPEYLGAVIADEAGARIGNAPQPAASVLARDSVFALARRGLSPKQIGEMLHADLVLSGTLRALPAHYRMRAEMTRIADGSQDWVEDLLVERSRIAGPETALANIVNHRIGVGRLSIAASATADDLAPEVEVIEVSAQRSEAYELFQRARYEWQSLERHRMQDALRHLERATELDSSLIGARVDLVHLSVTQEIYGFMAPAIAADLARRTASSIPSVAAHHADSILPSLGWFACHVDRNLPAALSLFQRSAHVPHNAWVTRARAQFALSRHRFDEATGLLRAAIRIDPYSPLLQGRLAWALHLDGQAGASVDQIRKALELSLENESAGFYGINILAFNGDTAGALELAQSLVRRLPYFDLATSAHAYALAVAGRRDEARAVLDRLQWLSRERYVLKTITPLVYMELGEAELALAELRAADERRCPWFFQVLADPRLKPLHGRSEFDAMLNIIAAMELQAERDPQQD